MRILVVGDSYVPIEVFSEGLARLSGSHELAFLQIDQSGSFEPASESEQRIHEYAGDPEQVARALNGHEVLVVHGAPVTDRVLSAARAAPRLLRAGRAGQRGYGRCDRARHSCRHDPGEERRVRRRPGDGVHGHAGPAVPRGAAVSLGRQPGGGLDVRGRPVLRPRSASATRSGWSGSGTSAAGSRSAPARSACGSSCTTPTWTRPSRTAWSGSTRSPNSSGGPTSSRCTRAPPPRTRSLFDAGRVRGDEARELLPEHRPRDAGRRAGAGRRARVGPPGRGRARRRRSPGGARSAPAAAPSERRRSRRTSAGPPTRRCSAASR